MSRKLVDIRSHRNEPKLADFYYLEFEMLPNHVFRVTYDRETTENVCLQGLRLSLGDHFHPAYSLISRFRDVAPSTDSVSLMMTTYDQGLRTILDVDAGETCEDLGRIAAGHLMAVFLRLDGSAQRLRLLMSAAMKQLDAIKDEDVSWLRQCVGEQVTLYDEREGLSKIRLNQRHREQIKYVRKELALWQETFEKSLAERQALRNRAA